MQRGLPNPEPEDGETMVHTPVLPGETLRLLAPRPGATAVDCTLGLGGHAEMLLEAIQPGGFLLGFDRDPEAIRSSSQRLARFGRAFRAIHADYRTIGESLRGAGALPVDLILADLGVSSAQLLDPARGFTFSTDAPLDMRLDQSGGGESAADLLARLDEASLARLLKDLGEEPQARAIARAIVRERAASPIRSTKRLADIVVRSARFRDRSRIHPATRTFMALRIAVNDELRGLEAFVEDAVSCLRPGGRIGIISFHSLEDRPVKTALRRLSAGCICPPDLPACACGRTADVKLITRRAVRPSAEEIEANPRASSARLRVAEKL